MAGKSKAADEVDTDPPNLIHMGGRLRAERERLGLTRAAAAELMAMRESEIEKWENATRDGEGAGALTRLGRAGADVLFIITGTRNEVGKADGRPPEERFRGALTELPGEERQRLLLYLIAEELRHRLARGS